MRKLPSARSLYHQALGTVVLIAFAPALFLIVIIAFDRVMRALHPWPLVLFVGWLLWTIGRYTYSRWR